MVLGKWFHISVSWEMGEGAVDVDAWLWQEVLYWRIFFFSPHVGLYYYTPRYENSLVWFVCFLMLFICDNIIKHSSTMGLLEDCQYLCWHVCSKIASLKHHVLQTDLANAYVKFIVLFIFVSNGTRVTFSCSHKNFVKCMWCDVAHYVTLLVQKLQEEKSLSGVLFLITQRASALHISSAASPQVIPVLSLYCLPLPPN